MNLMAPVNSIESCIAQIEAGADEIYVGYRLDFFKRMSFSARAQIRGKTYIMPDKGEFRTIVQYANGKNVKVKLTANTAFFSDYPIKKMDIEKEYINYIQYAIECGVDAVIVADIGLMQLIKSLQLPIKVYASTLLDIDNIQQIQFLKDLNVCRVVFAYQCTLEELKLLAKDRTMEYEVFVYGGCSFGCNCMLGHSEKYGIPCENEYVTSDLQTSSKLICSSLDCALCSIWDLYNLGITSLKITGRERPYDRILPITKLFRIGIDFAKGSKSEQQYLRKINDIIPIWWRRNHCDLSQCKYKNNIIAKKSISNVIEKLDI